jgi:SPP1 family predicted phage head-tail adaptor
MGGIKTHETYTPIGSFNNRVTLLKPVTTKTSTGGAMPPAVVATVWAAVSMVRALDIEKAQNVVGEIRHKVVIRWRSGITSDMLVQLGTRILPIKAVKDPDERRVELWLFCFERSDGVAT